MIDLSIIKDDLRLGIVKPGLSFLFGSLNQNRDVKKFMGSLIILEVQPTDYIHEICYLAYSKYFRKLKENEKIPNYHAQFRIYDDNRMKMKWKEEKEEEYTEWAKLTR